QKISCSDLLQFQAMHYPEDTIYGDPTSISTLINYALKSHGSDGQELIGIFKTARKNKYEFQKKLDEWMAQRGLKTLSLKNLGHFVEQKTNENQLPELKSHEVLQS